MLNAAGMVVVFSALFAIRSDPAMLRDSMDGIDMEKAETREEVASRVATAAERIGASVFIVGFVQECRSPSRSSFWKHSRDIDTAMGHTAVE